VTLGTECGAAVHRAPAPTSDAPPARIRRPTRTDGADATPGDDDGLIAANDTRVDVDDPNVGEDDDWIAALPEHGKAGCYRRDRDRPMESHG
jgi:hypothetical protein